MLQLNSGKKGFTLTELLVTLAIISVMAGVALPMVKIAVKRTKEIQLRRSLRTLREAIDAYKKLADENKFEIDSDTEGYPPDLEVLVKGVEITETVDGKETIKMVKFLRRIPKDPMTNSFEWGLRSYQDDYDTTSWGGENVFDVYTRNEGIALDGSRYREWVP
jgi:general secretion pathway protein G